MERMETLYGYNINTCVRKKPRSIYFIIAMQIKNCRKIFNEVVIQQNDPLIISEGKDRIAEAKTKITCLVSTLTWLYIDNLLYKASL